MFGDAIKAEKVAIVVVVLTLTHRYNAVRGHRAGPNNSGVEDYLARYCCSFTFLIPGIIKDACYLRQKKTCELRSAVRLTGQM